MNEDQQDKVGRDEGLRAAKRRVREACLGRAGVHGVGTRQSEDAVCLYIDAPGAAWEADLERLRSLAAPHRLVIVEEAPPRAL